MMDYKETVVRQHPEYINKNLLLTEASRERLFRTTKEGNCIELYFNRNGKLSAYEIMEDGHRIPKPIDNESLRHVGEHYLKLDDPSVDQMLRYLVIPEMEIERIFNCLRYKYLEMLKHGRRGPQNYITSDCNDLFKSLIKGNFRGWTKKRLPSKYNEIFRKAEFQLKSTMGIENERKALEFILRYIRSTLFDNSEIDIQEKMRMYKELIAIKPGFHEIYVRTEEHENGIKTVDDNRRNRVLKIIHGICPDEDIDLNKLNNEINHHSFLTYAPCNITEGPFVLRKKISTSYYSEIRRGKKRIDTEKKFMVLDYFEPKISTGKELDDLLIRADRFRYFAT